MAPGSLRGEESADIAWEVASSNRAASAGASTGGKGVEYSPNPSMRAAAASHAAFAKRHGL
eukprot:scaffold179852_cov32-Tisochrysis_lutea.AAC.2